jgi:predicted phage terminase large subunit-like protein
MMRPLYVTVGVDLAISESLQADYSVAIVVGQDMAENIYVLDYWRDRTGDIDIICDNIFRLCLANGAALVNIESVQYQQAMKNYFEKKMQERNHWVGVEGTKPRTSKDARIRSMQPLFASGKVFLRTGMNDLEEELEYYPNSSHKDLLDALYYGIAVSSPAQIGDRPLGTLAKTAGYGSRGKEVTDWLVL